MERRGSGELAIKDLHVPMISTRAMKMPTEIAGVDYEELACCSACSYSQAAVIDH
jgi:hypothetical protein